MLRVGHFYSLLQPRVAFSLLRRFERELSRRDVGCRAPSALLLAASLAPQRDSCLWPH